MNWLPFVLTAAGIVLGCAGVWYFDNPGHKSGESDRSRIIAGIVAALIQTALLALALLCAWQLTVLILGHLHVGVGIDIFLPVFWILLGMAAFFFAYRQIRSTPWYRITTSDRERDSRRALIVIVILAEAVLAILLVFACLTMAYAWPSAHAPASQNGAKSPFANSSAANWSWSEYVSDLKTAPADVRTANYWCLAKVTGITRKQAQRYARWDNQEELYAQGILIVGSSVTANQARTKLAAQGVTGVYYSSGIHGRLPVERFNTITVYGAGCKGTKLSGSAVRLTLTGLVHPLRRDTSNARRGVGVLPGGYIWVKH